ncbi:hypothetical protein Zmor_011215 [Zophobas morio]|uniref:Uncharacterized protein n=1 Tax=Zophobas morio TaxID=2755281 RepID=A0AA38ISU6_9CUCU|nr:hypothetical protein Zmor_011215 [Zophobas morio]
MDLANLRKIRYVVLMPVRILNFWRIFFFLRATVRATYLEKDIPEIVLVQNNSSIYRANTVPDWFEDHAESNRISWAQMVLTEHDQEQETNVGKSCFGNMEKNATWKSLHEFGK